MRKARFTEHQIITVVKSVKAGIPEANNYNYNLRTKCSDMEASDLKKLKRLKMKTNFLNRDLLT